MVFAPLGRNLSLRTEIRKERVREMKWKNEAMEKLRKYDVMRQALRNIPAEIERLQADACDLRGVAMDKTPVKGGGGHREEALINNFVQRQELKLTLEQVKRWLHVTDRGLLALTEEERLVLQRLYLYPEKGAIDRLCNELGVEQSSVYRKRDQALERFTIAMYGFGET